MKTVPAPTSRPSLPRRLTYAALGRLPAGLALPILGGPLRGKRWLIRSANYSCWLGSYEHAKQSAFSTVVQPGMVVFDIGAHVGFYSLLSAVLSAPNGKVYAFEPFPANAAKLRQNVGMNHVSVEVIESAVADQVGMARFAQGADSYTGGLGSNRSEGVEVRVTTIDALRRAGTLRPPNVMKIDVEGAEGPVLRGAAETIKASQPMIFLAVHGTAARTECMELLDDLGYSAEVLVGSGIESGSEYIARPARLAESGPAPLP